MSAPTFTMRELLEAGVHFGHQTHRWNPKMERFLYGVRNGIHIIDLQQTVPLLYRALEFVQQVVGKGGRVLFVGTKRQAQEPLAEAARRCGQYYVNHRWLGGMLTNWRTISHSISRLRALDEQLADEGTGLTKKELLNLTRERDRLERTLGGIREMGGLPDVLFIIDTNKEEIARHEAIKLGIPVVAIIDSNSDPAGIEYLIPGNDDATRSINLYCDLMARAVIGGLQAEKAARGADIGAAEEAPVEDLSEVEEAAAVEAPTAASAEPVADAETEAPAAAASEPEAGAETEAPAAAASEPEAGAETEAPAAAASEPEAGAETEAPAAAASEPEVGAETESAVTPGGEAETAAPAAAAVETAPEPAEAAAEPAGEETSEAETGEARPSAPSE
jgi:small subunit ribosomal protein S2